MAFNRFEQSLVDQYTNTQFPDLPPEPEQPMPADGVQLAMGGNAARRSDAPLSDVPIALWDTLAGALRGTVAQTLGLPGDVESLVRMLSGGKQVLPTTERMGEILPPVVPPSAPGAEMRQKTAEVAGKFGEFNPVMGAPEAVKLGVKGVKAVAPMIPKNVPVGASTDVVGGGTQAMLQAGKATAPVSDIGFYSAVEDAALNLQRKSGSGQAMLNDITKAANVKADEIKWIGLDDFLKGKKNVTKEEVQQFIAQNKVDVQEVQLGTESTRWEGNTLLVDNKPIGEIRDSGVGYVWMKPDGTYTELQGNRMFDAVDEVMKLTGISTKPQTRETMPKFGAYTLPGGENYREILLTLPNVKGIGLTAKETERLNALVDKRVGSSLAGLDDAEQKEYFALIKKREESASGYKSSHWNEPNVLAHIRVNDRVDADGKKMLLVEEVQSDWHQAGRDKGYKDDASLEKQFADLTQQHREVVTRRAEIVADPDKADEYKALSKQEQQLIDQMNKLHDTKQYGVPDAPMKDTWYQLALKRVLKYAADNGYERVGLTTGSRQAERYDLSKQIDSIEFNKMPDGNIFWTAYKDGKRAVGNDSTPSELESQVGKELAKKIIEHEGPGKLSGIDLQVGGEGMKKYYDEVYPQFLAKYGKKWGAKVGETRIETEQSPKSWAYFREWFAANHSNVGGSSTALAQWESGEKSKYVREFLKQNKAQEPVRFVDITPQMRESVGKGQPLFTATGLGTGTAATMQDKEQK